MGHHFYDLNFFLDNLFLVINNLCIIFRFIFNFPFNKKKSNFFKKMYCSTWNMNLFKVSNLFHVYK